MQSINPVVLAFAIWAIVSLRKSVESAVVDVFLSALLLIPFAFSIHIPHLPTLTCIDAVILPIGIMALLTRSHLWRFQRADVWVILFVLGSGYTDIVNLGLLTAVFNFPTVLCEAFFAYVIGKVVIEQSGMRERFSQRFVVLLSAIGFVSITEFIGRKNIFLMFGRRFQTEGYLYDQMRGGFMRVKATFAGAEEAGIVFMIGIFFALWLWFMNRSRGNAGDRKYLGLRRSTLWVLGIALGLYMTLSRGPWLGVGAGFLVARIGMVKNSRLAIALALVLGVAGGVYGHIKSTQLANLDPNDLSMDETTASAHYRTLLYTIYKPVAERGGLFGWSATGYPRDPHVDSIDNEFILLWVTQGKVGLWSFVLVAVEGAIGIAQAVRRSRQRLDICFYYCLGGILAGIMLVLSTVYLKGQGFVLFFLIVGMTQSLRDQCGETESPPVGSVARFNFKRVFA